MMEDDGSRIGTHEIRTMMHGSRWKLERFGLKGYGIAQEHPQAVTDLQAQAPRAQESCS